ncbi:PEGA domain-containing protein [Pyxidicoccus fallax]|uniref:PEGA domain-containing protein n=1 Tax=Pyxidicoccus fallax TaxID=394095 RepID=A0A848LTN5_9BACT|nr:PEGA domain-containing protein [Pyxidicoccus fallax]NMO20754.1 PEGA domain-containing protein [Pyxidicoccus fallax]NPC83228.1 PEGA domain-containing protein [Pyxidicoccus fallax]
MSFQRFVLFVLVALLAVPSSAFAQDDDDPLAPPLAPKPKSSRTKAGKTKVVKKKPAREKPAKVTKKPAKTPKTKTARGKAGKKAVEPVVEDDPLAPPQMLAKTELLVRISGNVKGAKLLVDGKDAGILTAAPVPVEVTPGEHLLVVRKPGYADFTKRIDVKEGSQTDVAVSLEANMGFASLTADVPEAVVFVDGEELGRVPQMNVLLKTGSREIEFRAPGFKPDVHNITVFAGRTYAVEGQLRPLEDTSTVASAEDVPRKPGLDARPRDTTTTVGGLDQPNPDDITDEVSSSKPWYGRWYVWAGVGAVVAAGTVGAVMATQGGGADPLTQEEICPEGGCVFLGGARPVRGGGKARGGTVLRIPDAALRF